MENDCFNNYYGNNLNKKDVNNNKLPVSTTEINKKVMPELRLVRFKEQYKAKLTTVLDKQPKQTYNQKVQAMKDKIKEYQRIDKEENERLVYLKKLKEEKFEKLEQERIKQIRKQNKPIELIKQRDDLTIIKQQVKLLLNTYIYKNPTMNYLFYEDQLYDCDVNGVSITNTTKQDSKGLNLELAMKYEYESCIEILMKDFIDIVKYESEKNKPKLLTTAIKKFTNDFEKMVKLDNINFSVYNTEINVLHKKEKLHSVDIHKKNSSQKSIRNTFSKNIRAISICKTIIDKLNVLFGPNSKSKTAFESIKECRDKFQQKNNAIHIYSSK